MKLFCETLALKNNKSLIFFSEDDGYYTGSIANPVATSSDSPDEIILLFDSATDTWMIQQ
jgi:hypothetical protein